MGHGGEERGVGRGGDRLFLSEAAAGTMRDEIAQAGGREVCFVARVGAGGEVIEARVTARGRRDAVLVADRDAEPGMLLVHNHPSGELEPSDADLSVAAELYAQGLGLAIVNNDATSLYVVVAPHVERELTLLDPAAVAAALASDGVVGRAHPAYEDRPEQRSMAASVAEAYNQGGIALIEAGTGTGKSIAYLIPALAWAALNRERTVVSTNTINLQEQLVTKDLPFLRAALGEPFRHALLKGRHNYISIRRAGLASSAEGALFEGAERSELRALTAWLDGTADGSLQDLPFTPSPEVWDEVVSDPDACLRARCPHFEACFYQQSRREAAAADVLVVNHHLLFSDVAIRRAQANHTGPAVLPPYRRLILDEAHNIEDAATSHLGAALSQRGVFRALGRLERRGRGLLRAFEERLGGGGRGAGGGAGGAEALAIIATSLRPAVERARERAAELFVVLDRLAARGDDGVLRYRLDELMGDADWQGAGAPALESLRVLLESIVGELGRVESRVRDDAGREALAERLMELEGARNRVLATLEALRLAFTESAAEGALVRWLERRPRAHDSLVTVRVAPVEVAAALRESLFERVDSAVLTSATLRTRNGFGFVRGRLGLDHDALRVAEKAYASPFDFATQTLLAVPTDLPAPAQGEAAAYDTATARVVAEVAAASDGGVFVLFTSYRALRRVAAELRSAGVDGDWPLHVQGEAPRAQLLARFTASGRSVLLGVASFWEGVDVPGEPLRGLVIPRLPFRVPTEPLTAARIEAIDSAGGNSFRDFMLPHAALRLKQGFGRLIRSRTDRGCVVLLDRRVLEKSYGRYFLGSLPEAPLVSGPWHELRHRVSAFYRPETAGAAVAG
jgi:ATP-dependent DNA helicase DinG